MGFMSCKTEEGYDAMINLGTVMHIVPCGGDLYDVVFETHEKKYSINHTRSDIENKYFRSWVIFNALEGETVFFNPRFVQAIETQPDIDLLKVVLFGSKPFILSFKENEPYYRNSIYFTRDLL